MRPRPCPCPLETLLPRTPSLDSWNPAPGNPGPLGDLSFCPEPLHFDTGSLALVVPGSPLLCSLHESGLYSPGSLSPFPCGPYFRESAPTRTYPFEPHTLIPGTATLLQGSLDLRSLAPRISPSPVPVPAYIMVLWADLPPTHTWLVPPQVSSLRR